jgi:hypothetical protein
VHKTIKNIVVVYPLVVNEKSFSALRDLIKPHLVNFMCYKVSDGQKGRLLEKLFIN